MALTEEQSLRQAIAHEEANLATLEQEQQNSRGRLAVLKAELTALASPIAIPPTSATQPSASIPTTPKEKISLFRKLFRLDTILADDAAARAVAFEYIESGRAVTA